jgi:undecaprenyl-diphosphatase
MISMSLLQSGAALASAAHGCPAHMTYTEAGIVGLVQGVSELFPVSSLGHNVLIPALVGGCWAKNLSVSASESPYLAYIVGLHVATAFALIIYFWRDWLRIIGGFFSSLAHIARPAPGERRFELRSADERLAWMIILATIPVGVVGLGAEHAFRTIFGKATYAAVFLVINGLILLAGERFRRRSSERAGRQPASDPDFARERGPRYASGPAGDYSAAYGHGYEAEYDRVGTRTAAVEDEDWYQPTQARHASGSRARRVEELDEATASDQRLAGMRYREAILIGTAQILALLAGISRSGVTMATGMFRGLSHEDAARFAFLLATPVILAAGALKVPDLLGPLGRGIHGQVLLGSVLSGIGAYISVRFLVRYFQTRTLTPFAIYCLIAGLGSIAYLQLVK